MTVFLQKKRYIFTVVSVFIFFIFVACQNNKHKSSKAELHTRHKPLSFFPGLHKFDFMILKYYTITLSVLSSIYTWISARIWNMKPGECFLSLFILRHIMVPSQSGGVVYLPDFNNTISFSSVLQLNTWTLDWLLKHFKPANCVNGTWKLHKNSYVYGVHLRRKTFTCHNETSLLSIKRIVFSCHNVLVFADIMTAVSECWALITCWWWCH